MLENIVRTDRHTTFYLASGAQDAPLIVFVHGWPELSISWRHQLPCLAGLGFRAVAPDMRGYGRSRVYARHEDYALEHAVADMLELLDAMGREKAVWVGHDWGSPVVWSLASHHPERCFGGAGRAPDVPLDTDVLTEADLHMYVAALEGNGFFGPDSWYMNQSRNLEFASRAVNGGMLTLPVLFLHGEYDFVCETVTSRLAEPMRQDCANLTEVRVPSGHWMAQERPEAVNAALARWLAAQLPELWIA